MPGRDFDAVFEALKDIMARYEPKLVVVADDDKRYYLNTAIIHPKNKKPIAFGAVCKMKSYVSYHLFPVYMCRDLIESMSPELKKHMQGKACFNFKEVDKAVFKELAKLTKAGFDRFKKDKLQALLKI